MKTIKLFILLLLSVTFSYAQTDSTTSIVKAKFMDAVDSTVYNVGDVITLSLDRTKQVVTNASKVDYIEVIGSIGGSEGSVAWADITGKPTTFAPIIGTTSTTAKAGNYVPTYAEVTGKPTTFAPTIGTTATTAAAGNHTHAAVTGTTAGFMTAAQKAALNALTAIADPSTATAPDIAAKVNEIITALKTP